MLLKGFDHVSFLREHWQQKPLLIRHRGTPFVDPVDPDELAGLACEPDMESRLVSRLGHASWRLRHGPFDPRTFAELPETNWTLLVQAVDQVIEGVEALKQYFAFLPAWRIDDVMISFACDGGGVGPHYDQYDVFLIQGKGSRIWQVGERCEAGIELRADSELSLLENFEPLQEYILEPGDILYLPPRFAHHGVSRGESLCYSIGFRAPSHAELVQEFCDVLTQSLCEDLRFQDPAFNYANSWAEISEEVISSALQQVTALLSDRTAFTDAFAGFVTRPRYPERVVPTDCDLETEQLLKMLSEPGSALYLQRNPASRFAFIQDQDEIRLYVDGKLYRRPTTQLSLISQLCDISWIDPMFPRDQPWLPADISLLAQLINQGNLHVLNGNEAGIGDD